MGQRIGQVSQLWRYPVKSMAGHRVPRASVTEQFGLCGDRGWALRDEEAGEIRGARRMRSLLFFEARYTAEPTGIEDPPVEITLPDGSVTGSEDPQVHDKLSAALGRRVTLWPRQPDTDLEHYRKAAEPSERELRQMLALDDADEMPHFMMDQQGRRILMPEYITRPGTYFDAFSLSLLTTTSLNTLAADAPDSVVDLRRFRKNLIVDTSQTAGDAPYPEFDWVGRVIRLGEARVEVVRKVPRCAMVTLAQDGVPKDRQILRTLARTVRSEYGVYLRVLEPGQIAEGDSVHLEES